MQTSDILHYACRAKDPEKKGYFYARLFDGQFFLHPVMTPLGIVNLHAAPPPRAP